MTPELLAAIAELCAWAARDGAHMEHMTDAEVLEGIQLAMTSLPSSTAKVVEQYGLSRVASILPQLQPVQRRGAKHHQQAVQEVLFSAARIELRFGDWARFESRLRRREAAHRVNSGDELLEAIAVDLP